MTEFTTDDLTINICTIDRPDFLRACIASLIRTTPPNTRLNIVFNGTPQDIIYQTVLQLGDWQGPVQTAILPETVPLDESHNLALGMVETRLVNFMGDDDLVLGSRLENILCAFGTLKPEPAVVTTFARRIGGDADQPKIGSLKGLGPTTISEWRQWVRQERIFEMLWPGAVISTEALRKSGGFEARFNKSVDNRIFSKLALASPVVSLRDDSFGYRIHQGSVSTSDWQEQNQHVRYVAACHKALCAKTPEPEFDAFIASEAKATKFNRARIQLRDRSRMHFRRGGALMLEDQTLRGSGNLLASVILWPPAFVQKVKDQLGRS